MLITGLFTLFVELMIVLVWVCVPIAAAIDAIAGRTLAWKRYLWSAVIATTALLVVKFVLLAG